VGCGDNEGGGNGKMTRISKPIKVWKKKEKKTTTLWTGQRGTKTRGPSQSNKFRFPQKKGQEKKESNCDTRKWEWDTADFPSECEPEEEKKKGPTWMKKWEGMEIGHDLLIKRDEGQKKR